MPKGAVMSRNGAKGGVLRKLGTVYWDKTNLTYKIKAPKAVESTANTFLNSARDNLERLPLFSAEANKERSRYGMSDADLFRYFGETPNGVRAKMREATRQAAHGRKDKVTGELITTQLKRRNSHINKKYLSKEDRKAGRINSAWTNEDQQKVNDLQAARIRVKQMKKSNPVAYQQYKDEKKEIRKQYAKARKEAVRHAEAGRDAKYLSKGSPINVYKGFSAKKSAIPQRKKRAFAPIDNNTREASLAASGMDTSDSLQYHSVNPRSSYNHYAMDDSD